ncbi:heme-binding protein [Frigoribacterium sp. Leaf44]|uniref:heme-binding protein n=1 Tax=Frigoribacterium sp. Leaf44 TaxID=1736220 RepID=UPI0006F79504|nr:heme-binding protein [Frigoribacterium sp. Leaf44]KQN41979.1 hypothetical protein ASE87_12410 [Frigoribacterium sp. Leaf44]
MRLPRTTLVTLAALAVAVTAGCTSTSSPSPDSTTARLASTVTEGSVVQAQRLSSSEAMKAASAALAAAEADGTGFVSVSVVDRNGQLQAFVRGENAAAHTLDASREKAYTAAAFGAATSELAERASGDGVGLRDLDGTLFLAGGVPVKAGESSIGGIGVGGAPSGDKDQEYAKAGLDAIAG